jgi:hypothetical protein
MAFLVTHYSQLTTHYLLLLLIRRVKRKREKQADAKSSLAHNGFMMSIIPFEIKRNTCYASLEQQQLAKDVGRAMKRREIGSLQ